MLEKHGTLMAQGSCLAQPPPGIVWQRGPTRAVWERRLAEAGASSPGASAAVAPTGGGSSLPRAARPSDAAPQRATMKKAVLVPRESRSPQPRPRSSPPMPKRSANARPWSARVHSSMPPCAFGTCLCSPRQCFPTAAVLLGQAEMVAPRLAALPLQRALALALGQRLQPALLRPRTRRRPQRVRAGQRRTGPEPRVGAVQGTRPATSSSARRVCSRTLHWSKWPTFAFASTTTQRPSGTADGCSRKTTPCPRQQPMRARSRRPLPPRGLRLTRQGTRARTGPSRLHRAPGRRQPRTRPLSAA
mmetsp:Transcript_85932/g.191253  ORF Transcript_85932/g.191253 Transcript_85932/m.191253 type:complete len:303 (+) Transcript_85932:1832-2740(+)